MIDDSTITLFGAGLLFILPVHIKEWKFKMDWKIAVKIPWGILLLFGGGVCLSKEFLISGLADRVAHFFHI
jgi:sodium-dependent dicarboxylate transporter 2/3/5